MCIYVRAKNDMPCLVAAHALDCLLVFVVGPRPNLQQTEQILMRQPWLDTQNDCHFEMTCVKVNV